MAVPSIFIVAPRGKTKEITSFDEFNFSTHFMLIGKVPTDDALEKENMMAGSISLKKRTGEILPKIETVEEYTRNA